VDYQRYSVFEDDEEECMETRRMTYSGRIKPGMGVQKRYTGGSFFLGDIKDVEFEEEEEWDGGRDEKKRTWGVHDPLERWRRGLHPLQGKRGPGTMSLGYF
jgi:hypothetical protein